MNNVYINRAASANQINLLADWVRKTLLSTTGKFDAVRFVEIDLPKLFPGIYVHIEADKKMGNRRAFVAERPLGIVVSESTYEGASNGCLFSQEVILHEVGHLILHYRYAVLKLNSASGPYTDRVKNTSLSNSAEWQATAFALSLLFPFSELKNVRSHSEIVKKYNLSCNYAQRVNNHLKRIRLRQLNSNRFSDEKWLAGVISTLSNTNINRLETKFQSQIRLFFSPRTHREEITA